METVMVVVVVTMVLVTVPLAVVGMVLAIEKTIIISWIKDNVYLSTSNIQMYLLGLSSLSVLAAVALSCI